VVLFFFSGHGTAGRNVAPLDETGGLDEYLCSYGSITSQYLRDDELSEWLGELRTTNIVVILDTCFSGGQIKAEAGTVRSLPSAPAGVVRKGDGFSADLARRIAPRDMDDNFLRNGLFSYFVMGRLETNPDRNGNGEFSAEELFGHSWPRVRWLSRRLPSVDQHPQIRDGYPAADPSAARLAVGVGPSSRLLPAAHGDNVLADEP